MFVIDFYSFKVIYRSLFTKRIYYSFPSCFAFSYEGALKKIKEVANKELPPECEIIQIIRNDKQ